MPPKEKKKKAGGGANDVMDQKNQKLQAILLADTFKQTFRPVTLERPQMLLPLVNVPMMEYTVEFLAQNGVEEIFIVCVWGAEKLQQYVDSAKWSKGLTVHCIQLASCLSAGDALRELDSQGLIRSDPFVLISGDVVSNMNLKKAIEFHKERRKDDMNAIMTVVLKPVQKGAGVKPVMDDLVVAFDKYTSQLLLFDDDIKKENIDLPLEIIEDHPNLVVRTDLLDCQVDICSPELIMQFSDNFDYQDIRKDFIQNEVINWELGMHVYGYILNNLPPYTLSEYAARVQDPRTYHSICRDIVTRWVYPFVPDARLLRDDDTVLVQGRRNVYKERGTSIARSAIVGEGTVLGRGAVVEDDVTLYRAIVGRDCVVGKSSRLIECHVWKGARIESDCKITQAIICENVVVKRGAVVGRGCLVSDGVIIGEGVVLPEYSRVTKLSKAEVERLEEGDSNFVVEENSEKAAELVGEDGKGSLYLWRGYEGAWDDDSDSDGGGEDAGTMNVTGDSSGSSLMSKESYFKAMNMGCEEQEEARRRMWRSMPAPTNEEEDDDFSDLEGEEEQEMAAFIRGVSDMIVSGKTDGHSAENILMEIKGLKFAQNKTFGDCLRGVVPQLLALPFVSSDGSGQRLQGLKTMEILASLKASLGEGGWGYNVIKPLIQDQDDELTVVEAAEQAVLSGEHKGDLYGIFRMVLQLLYEAEVLSQEALEDWISERRDLLADDSEDPRVVLFKEPMVQAFVEWLEDDEDDDSDEEEDDDDADDEDDEE